MQKLKVDYYAVSKADLQQIVVDMLNLDLNKINFETAYLSEIDANNICYQYIYKQQEVSEKIAMFKDVVAVEAKELQNSNYLVKVYTECDPVVSDFEVNQEDICSKDGHGHTYVEEYTNKDVQILSCTKCGSKSVGYFHQPK